MPLATGVDEPLIRQQFLGLDEAKGLLDEWRNASNHRWLFSGIGGRMPAAYEC